MQINIIQLLFSIIAISSIAFTGVLGNSQSAYAGNECLFLNKVKIIITKCKTEIAT